jgi:hypothetical protein
MYEEAKGFVAGDEWSEARFLQMKEIHVDAGISTVLEVDALNPSIPRHDKDYGIDVFCTIWLRFRARLGFSLNLIGFNELKRVRCNAQHRHVTATGLSIN